MSRAPGTRSRAGGSQAPTAPSRGIESRREAPLEAVALATTGERSTELRSSPIAIDRTRSADDCRSIERLRVLRVSTPFRAVGHERGAGGDRGARSARRALADLRAGSFHRSGVRANERKFDARPPLNPGTGTRAFRACVGRVHGVRDSSRTDEFAGEDAGAPRVDGRTCAVVASRLREDDDALRGWRALSCPSALPRGAGPWTRRGRFAAEKQRVASLSPRRLAAHWRRSSRER